MRVVALLATYNEERFVGGCIEHLARQGVETYLIDNGSTDRTVEIAERAGVVGTEIIPRHGVYAWRPLLERKEALAATLDADWFVHLDADEIRLPPRPGITLAEAIAEVDALGYNVVNFLEYAFVPTREAPDHDHPRYEQTMRHYYPFYPGCPDRLNAWKRQEGPVALAHYGGHRVEFPGLNPYPDWFPMRHYLFLSVPHAISKYVERVYDPAEVEAGWHVRRAALALENITLVSQAELRETRSDDDLDPADPWPAHPLFAPS
jgi:glycosyltransferase involved in cell wall biosynthesis